jgi:DNA repair exonuclease SbcCD ATPase subunit
MSKNKDATTDPANAVESARGILEELREELQAWYDNLPENFQNGSKGETLQSAIDQLESADGYLEEPPTCAELLTVNYSFSTKRKQSRADRCADACSLLAGCVDAAREKATELQEAQALSSEANQDQTGLDEATKEKIAKEAKQVESDISELESFADACESAKDEAEATEFPGMFG